MADRSVLAVPRPALALLALTFSMQIGMQAIQPPPAARAEALPAPPTPAMVKAASLDEPIAAAQLLTLYLQAFDNQPGLSIPFRDLDYPRVIGWLETILALDATGQYPLLMASQLYAQVPIEDKQRSMLDFVHKKFREDPEHRWRWLAHATILAKHRLKDNGLALRYADDLAGLAPGAPSWARQMRIFILEDMGELESATILLGGLLATGEVNDPNEIHFLTQRLEQMKKIAEKSAPVSKN
jgi:hypothetical protein